MPSGIYKRTEEWKLQHREAMGKLTTRQKMRKARLGKEPWNKGKILGKNPEHSKIMTGKVSPMKGKKHTQEAKLKMKISATGIHLKENNGQWKGGVTPINKQIRNSVEYRDWRIAVFERDNYTCQDCGSRGVTLQADHIKSFAYYPELRLVIENGRTLCVPCHKKTDNYAWKARLENTNLIANVKSLDTNV
jgi:hypothetical protein